MLDKMGCLSMNSFEQCTVLIILYDFEFTARMVRQCNWAWVSWVVQIILSAVIDDLKRSRIRVIGYYIIFFPVCQAVNAEAFTNISNTHITTKLSFCYHTSIVRTEPD